MRICVEGGLPTSYLWRHLRDGVAMPDIVRQRALMMFSKLRVWDTSDNNGVLIYLLLAEHAIELVADRGVARYVDPAVWQTVVAQQSDIRINQEPGNIIQMPASPQLADVVKALNTLGATPGDLLAILQAIKAAGALNAELEVI